MPTPTNLDQAPNPEDTDFLASQAQRERLLKKAAAEVEAAGFRDENTELQGTLRRLSALPMETRDLRMLERILRHARWLREQ